MNDRELSSIQIGPRYRKDLGDISQLAASIAEIGLLHPVVVTPEGMLIAGERRVHAFKSLGRSHIPTTVLDIAAIARGELDENAARKSLTPSEEVDAARAVEEEEQRLAKQRMSEGGKGRKISLPSEAGQTRDRIAARIGGASGRTLEKARAIVEAAEQAPQVFGKLVEDMDRTGRVDGPYKRLKVIKQAEEIRRAPSPLPNGPFPVIVVDPPWPYRLRHADGSHRGTTPYPQMSVADICAMPIADIAAEDCILWLWATNAFMREAIAVLDAWAFQHKTILTWAKNKMGGGDWLRGQTEHCLMAVRGKPNAVAKPGARALA
jgi:ParB-like chromosome segregation protein Spo0J